MVFLSLLSQPPVTEPNLKVAHQRFNRLFRNTLLGPSRAHVKEADDLVTSRTPQGLNHVRVSRIAACAPDTTKAERISRQLRPVQSSSNRVSLLVTRDFFVCYRMQQSRNDHGCAQWRRERFGELSFSSDTPCSFRLS